MTAPAREITFTAAGERVYSAGELAELLGVAPSAVSQWRARTGSSVTLPAPAFSVPDSRYARDRGFWTGPQVAAFLCDYRARATLELERARTRRRGAVRASVAARERIRRADVALDKIGAYDGADGSGTVSRNGRERDV